MIVECPLSDFITAPNTHPPGSNTTRCFTFNHSGTQRSVRAGPRYGLRLFMRVNQRAMHTPAANVLVLVHGQGVPLTDDDQVLPAHAATGSATAIALTLVCKIV